MQPADLAFLSLQSIALAIILLLIFYLVALLFRLPKSGGMNVLNQPFLVKLVFSATVISGFILALGIVGVVVSLLWWLGVSVLDIHTPGKLAITSIIFGISPLLLVVTASVLTKAIGGTLNESGYQNCRIKNIDFGPMLYGLFMMGWATIFTGGLAVIGLIVAGVWKLLL